MALGTFEDLWRAVLLRCPLAGPFLAADWVKFAFRQVAERRRWSWLQRPGQLVVNDVVSTGQVALTQGDATVTAIGTTFDGSLVGRQFRVSFQYPIATVSSVADDGSSLTLDQVWGGLTLSAVGYEIYNAYLTPPDDFHAWLSVVDTGYNWQLHTLVSTTDIDRYDAQRANAGSGWVVAFRDYDPLAAAGSPPLPRFELWPHQKSAKVYPFLYEARATDLSDADAALPRYVRGDVLLEGALAQCAMWPGPSATTPNPYFNLALSDRHRTAFERMVNELELQDDNIQDQSVRYQAWATLPFAPLPWADARWLQSHAI